ncbi:hypothetical protein BESB_050850 [Besnoitia besnoiti]|uniref:Uncharacterized protein n=1 Tax=Besnoitia besnoiti TaxID=94643 RepID=A0A2A9LWZ2_BESBE|nr:uncharacterized protein BESB_050850 [Besnoitia besnoiti]PFH31008.1 hypothetical protein BESB_050850 [Besnoitia besnoiti]
MVFNWFYIHNSYHLNYLCIKYSGIQRIFEKPTFVYKLYEYHDIHFGSRLLNVSLYGYTDRILVGPGTCLVTG